MSTRNQKPTKSGPFRGSFAGVGLCSCTSRLAARFPARVARCPRPRHDRACLIYCSLLSLFNIHDLFPTNWQSGGFGQSGGCGQRFPSGWSGPTTTHTTHTTRNTREQNKVHFASRKRTLSPARHVLEDTSHQIRPKIDAGDASLLMGSIN
jgi:hypothetical protein